MTATYNINVPIETLYKRVEEYVQYSAAANTPFADPHIFSSASRLIQKTGMSTEDCKAWKKRPAIEKTWTQLRIDFTRAHIELRETQDTSSTSGFHAKHAQSLQQETAEEISNLVNTTLADRETIASV